MTPQFKRAVETYGPRFMADLGLDALKVSAMFGNFAVESDQFRALQEYKPVVAGSRGGWGWAQWTGPRRREFEAFADAQGLKGDDPDAFYRFTLHELRTTEKAALTALRRTKTLDSATTTVMKRYERPGVEHLQKRKAYALEALHALEAKIMPTPPKRPASDRMETGEKPTISPLPTAPTVPVPPTPETRPWWKRLLGINRPVPSPRPGLAPAGDPVLYDIQCTLKRLKYPVGLLDGLMGKNTKTAIRQARVRNGLPPGDHLDDVFKAALPGMLPAEVSEERANAPPERLRQEAPETTRQLDGIGFIGKLILGASGLGAADATGALEKAKAIADQGSETLASIQTVVTFVITAVQWCIEHWWLLGILAGIVVLWRVAMAGLRLLVLLRQGRLI